MCIGALKDITTKDGRKTEMKEGMLMNKEKQTCTFTLWGNLVWKW